MPAGSILTDVVRLSDRRWTLERDKDRFEYELELAAGIASASDILVAREGGKSIVVERLSSSNGRDSNSAIKTCGTS